MYGWYINSDFRFLFFRSDNMLNLKLKKKKVEMKKKRLFCPLFVEHDNVCQLGNLERIVPIFETPRWFFSTKRLPSA